MDDWGGQIGVLWWRWWVVGVRRAKGCEDCVMGQLQAARVCDLGSGSKVSALQRRFQACTAWCDCLALILHLPSYLRLLRACITKGR